MMSMSIISVKYAYYLLFNYSLLRRSIIQFTLQLFSALLRNLKKFETEQFNLQLFSALLRNLKKFETEKNGGLY